MTRLFNLRRLAGILTALVVVGILLGAALAPDANASASSTMTPNCSASARVSASTAATRKAVVAVRSKVTATAVIHGGSWRASCAGKTVSGSTWLRISAINGHSVKSLYKVTYLYAAAGLFAKVKAASTPTPKPTPSPSASPTPTPVPPTIGTVHVTTAGLTFYGRGWGHGVGMSQAGADGRALAGQSAAPILAHYYQGTTIGPLAGGNRTVRVLLLRSWAATAATPLTITGLHAAWTVDGIPDPLPANAVLTAYPATTGSRTWHLHADSSAGKTLFDGAAASDFRVHAPDPATLELSGKPSNANTYRGTLRVMLSTSATVIDLVPMESYLRGVVPREMSPSSPAEALKAQAIAARSYAAYALRSTTKYTFDVFDDTRSQAYGGVRWEAKGSDDAVLATAGQVVLYQGKVADTLFHDSDGGATENDENVYVSATGAVVSDGLPYLRGSSDRRPNGTAWDSASARAVWKTKAYTQAELSAFFAKDARTDVGTLTALKFLTRGVSGRLMAITLTGSTGSHTVSGSIFVSVFNTWSPKADPAMWSTLVDVRPIP